MSKTTLTLSDKYTAGLTDSDGSINLQFKKLPNDWLARPTLVLVWAQRTDNDTVLYQLQNSVGGTIKIKHIGSGDYTHLTLCGKKARVCLERILPYLVIKKDFAQFCLDRMKLVWDGKDSSKKEYLTARQTCSPYPNFPARKWLAGYFDGDGCISFSRFNKNGSANLIACIVCSDYDRAGIDIIQKNFGGHIYPVSVTRPHLLQWRLALPPSKVIDFFGYFNQHSIIKRNQIDFILSQARTGHFSDGAYIRQELKQLKAPTSTD
jgi:hypothetical protein